MKKKGTVVVMLFAIVTVCFAETAQEVLEKLRSKYESLDDAEIVFAQKSKYELANIEQSTNGKLYYKKGNKYRVELEGQTIVTDGKTVWSYSKQNNQVLIDNFKMDRHALTPQKILTGAPDDFYAIMVGKESLRDRDTYIVKLVPKEDVSIVKAIKLWVDDSDWLTWKAEVQDINGKQTDYYVNSIKTDLGLADSLFTYYIPKGVEAVDLR